MYLLGQFKKQFQFCVVNYQENPESASLPDEKEITSASDIKEQTVQLGIDIAQIKDSLQELRDEAEQEQKIERAEEILERVGELKVFETRVGQQIHTLETGLSRLEEEDMRLGEDGIDSIFEDYDEISSIREDILRYKQEYNQYVEESEALQRTLETLAQNQLSQEEQEEYKTITNLEFLKLSDDERLRFITVGNITSGVVASGDMKNLEFTFTYDGVFNRDLYIRTTAGQVLPPEVREVTSGSEVFIRNGISGEFFTESGKRLKIHEATKIDVSKLATTEELEEIQNNITEDLGEYLGTPEEDIARFALEKGIDPKFAILMYGEDISALEGDARKVTIEDKITEIARFQDDFADERPGEVPFKDGIVTEKFAGYVANIISADIEKLVQEYDFDEDILRSMRRTERYSSGGALNMENVNIEGTSQEEIDRILKLDRFVPGSKEAQALFTVAAQSAGLPEEWATHPGLHRILSNESNGVVGRLNYTIPDSYTPARFKELALARRNNNPIGVRSTASGLGQLLLSNVDKYYPDGRRGLGDPLNEAVGMIRYIHDRYGSIDTAVALYGRTGTVNGVTKTFREGY